ncbi:hypothetical protein BDZ94DRAFT_806952 [Collybia nuda]|uniref:Uncharacterized protein n=1 Tax=Collybia nuda TaxID=64659 RepID=A0A9P6CD88_9AGAR|nr:hypothetical protein BDZ94DRAFT_806952 [Collybia nuda]
MSRHLRQRGGHPRHDLPSYRYIPPYSQLMVRCHRSGFYSLRHTIHRREIHCQGTGVHLSPSGHVRACVGGVIIRKYRRSCSSSFVILGILSTVAGDIDRPSWDTTRPPTLLHTHV